MKLSKREKILLSIVGILLSGFLYYKLVFVPENQRLKELDAQYQSHEVLLQRATDAESSIKKMKLEMAEDEKKIEEILTGFSSTARVPELLAELDRVADQNFVLIDEISFSGDAAAIKGIFDGNQDNKGNDAISDTLQKSMDAAANNAQALKDVLPKDNAVVANALGNTTDLAAKDPSKRAVRNLSIQLRFIGREKNCMDFIRHYENHDRVYITDRVSLQGSEEACSGEIQLSTFDIGEEEGFLYFP